MRQNVSALMKSDRAESGANEAVQVVVGLMIGGLLSAYLIPLVMDELVAVDTSGWTGGSAELWDLLGVMVVLAVFLFFVQLAVERGQEA